MSVGYSAKLGFASGKSFTITLYYKGSKVEGALIGKNYEDKSQALSWYLLWDDGKQEAEVKFNTKSGYGTSKGVVAIGRHYDRYTNSIIDDVALFNIVLTEEDFKEVMNKGLETTLSVSNTHKLALTWGKIKQ